MADIPAGTGLGSSGSFTTALLKALHAHNKHLVHSHELAEEACHLKIDILPKAIMVIPDRFVHLESSTWSWQRWQRRGSRGDNLEYKRSLL